MSERQPVVAIDGPSGSGKTTVARGAGAALDLPVLDTGAMYRAVTLLALEQHVDPSDERALGALAGGHDISAEGGRAEVDGRDVTAAVRSADVTATVSKVASHPAVRRELVRRQREWLDRHGAGVVEGRDIGTVVFPDAAVKVFLTADEEERARRRREDRAVTGRAASVEEEQRRMAERDRSDSTRHASPLARAEDAMIVDTTTRAPEEVVAEVVARWRESTDPRPSR